ncbi:hypothetical protein IE53DRAFT_15866 [Violaceomyces palustris]|uniref:Uncharacterized protein n=1 Tax=Violaceomyces palustris TaxID=1673888 RepID=A0ACD0NLI2_9BASI|nr:hypothetical protein IE53DRAFT_15866 [Violaceomyces palustris]
MRCWSVEEVWGWYAKIRGWEESGCWIWRMATRRSVMANSRWDFFPPLVLFSPQARRQAFSRPTEKPMGTLDGGKGSCYISCHVRRPNPRSITPHKKVLSLLRVCMRGKNSEDGGSTLTVSKSLAWSFAHSRPEPSTQSAAQVAWPDQEEEGKKSKEEKEERKKEEGRRNRRQEGTTLEDGEGQHPSPPDHRLGPTHPQPNLTPIHHQPTVACTLSNRLWGWSLRRV